MGANNGPNSKKAQLLGNLRLKSKLVFLMAVVLIGFIVSGVMGMYIIGEVKVGSGLYRTIQARKNALESIALLKSDLNQVRGELATMMSENDEDKIAQIEATVTELKTATGENFEGMLAALDSEEKKIALQDAQTTWTEFITTADGEFMPAIHAGDRTKARELANGIQKLRYERFIDQVGGIVDTLKLEIEELETNSEKTVKDKMTLAAVLSGALFLLVTGLTFLLANSIAQRIGRLKVFANKLADGDLSATESATAEKGGDEITELGRALGTMADNFKRLLGESLQSSCHVAVSADKVAGSAHRIAGTAQEEAAATEATTSSIEEMATSISQVAKNTEALVTNVEETSSTINEMAASIEQVGKSAELMAESVEQSSMTVGEMLSSIEQTARNSGEMTEAVSETSLSVENMLASIEQIGSSTESLRGLVLETSGTIEEMTRTIAEVSRRIEGASRLGQNASSEAEEGGKAIFRSIESLQNMGQNTEKTMSLIQNLGKRSNEIGSIVEVIDEIADQTNLLALNAAIEAARAGDAGRGFAVVAEEIRKLAERSMEATKEIAAVIKQVQQETVTAIKATEETYREGKGGITLAENSRDAFNAIITSVREISEVMQGIAKANVETNRATEQVMSYVVDMNASTDKVSDAVKMQVEGAGSIRLSLERMNRMVQEVNIAAKEQSAGGRRIREVVDRMKNLVHEVGVAVSEQVGGSRQIVRSVDIMQDIAQGVAVATQEQKRGGGTIVKAMEGMSRISTANLGLSKEMVDIAEDTLFKIETLQYSISNFRIHANGDRRCWDILNCPLDSREKCPAYNVGEDRCWMITGTWCKGEQQGDFRSKLRNCMTCEAFHVIQGITV